MNLPTVITLARLLSVPAIIWLILQQAWLAAFFAFLAAGLSDALDGFLARYLKQLSELGTFLDPLADKALLIGIYVTLGVLGEMPGWIVILVVSRDVLLIGGTLLSLVMETAIHVRPLLISKFNTVCQIVLVLTILAKLGMDWLVWIDPTPIIWIVAATTLLSGASYLIQWGRRHASDRISRKG